MALESTIIAHGMPYPENVRTAREVEALIRDLGAEPATIALIGGRIRIGLSDDELELAKTPVAVVCAGAKSILDIALTLEYLETHGVPVLS